MASRSSLEFIRHFFSSNQVYPKKALSQNFLIDSNIVKKIIKTSKASEGDFVLEIGPGLGALTEGLILQGCKVLAVEKDCSFDATLRELPIQLCMMDILKFSIEDNIPAKGRVIANLPYNITTPILVKLLTEGFHKWRSITVMVQDEVARRMCAHPGGKEYGSLTIFLNFFTHVEYAFKVSSSCFYPRPSVESAVIHMEVKKVLPLKTALQESFFLMTRTAFQQRRKFLTNSLKEIYQKDLVLDTLVSMGLSDKTRPEELSLEQYMQLFSLLNAHSTSLS